MTTLFISHSSKDKFFVRNLADRLVKSDLKVWIDEAEIKIGDSLIQKISEGVQDSDFLIVVLSQNSVASNWVQKELQLAMTKEILGNRIILPILIEKCEIPLFLRDKLYADFSQPEYFEVSFEKLLRSVGVETVEDIQTASGTSNITEEVKIPETKTSKNKQFVKIEYNVLEGFEDLKIVEVDKSKTYKPDNNKELYNVYFVLSDVPSREWVEIFEAERRFPRHSMWRKAWIDGYNIVVHCGLDEVKKFHMQDINEDVVNSNKKYRSYLKQLEVKKQKAIEKELNEKNKIDSALDDLF